MPLLVVKPTKPLPRKTVSANDELLLLLERGLPESISRTWMTSKEIETLFKKGGLTLPKRFVSNALKSNIDNSRCWAKNIFYDKLHLCFAGENNLAFATPKDQRGFLRDATTDEEKEKICPAISDGYFLDFQLKHLTKFRQPSSGSAATDCPPAASPTAAARNTAPNPQIPQTSSNPGFVDGDGRCGIRTILFILTWILKKTYRIYDGNSNCTVDDSIDWRIVKTPSARRVMAAAMKMYASVFVQARHDVYDESVILGEAADVQKFANNFLGADLATPLNLSTQVWANQFLIIGAAMHHKLNAEYFDSGSNTTIKLHNAGDNAETLSATFYPGPPGHFDLANHPRIQNIAPPNEQTQQGASISTLALF